MIRRIVIENFQSHARTELELSPGVTVLVGESDAGKSAVVRALKWLFLNEPRGGGFVRKGSRRCRVAAEYADGSVLVRERDSSENRYVLRLPDGREEVFAGFGADPPEEVVEFCGVRRFEAGGARVCPNVASQHDPPFLLAEPGPAAAAVIGMLSGADAFDEALRGALADKARAEREARALGEEIAALDEELRRFADLPAWEEALEKAAALLREAAELGRRKERLSALAAEAREVRGRLAAAEEVAAAAGGAAAAGPELEAAAEACSGSGKLAALAAGRGEALVGLSAAAGAAALASAAERAEPAAALAESLAEKASRLSRLAAERSAAREKLAGIRDGLAAASRAADAAGALSEAGLLAARASRLAAKASELAGTAAALERRRAAAELAAGAEAASGPLASAAASAGLSRTLAALAAERARLSARLARAAEVLPLIARAAGAGALLLECEEVLRKRDAAAALASGLAAARAALGEARARLADADGVLRAAAGELAAALREAGRCPVCLGEIGAGRAEEVAARIAG